MQSVKPEDCLYGHQPDVSSSSLEGDIQIAPNDVPEFYDKPYQYETIFHLVTTNDKRKNRTFATNMGNEGPDQTTHAHT